MRLIDADALIGALHGCAFLEGDDRSICYNVIQKQPTACGWVSVKDRLPERYMSVLALVQDSDRISWRRKIAWLNGDKWVFDTDESFDEEELDDCESVTHWMPLPEPPKEDEL